MRNEDKVRLTGLFFSLDDEGQPVTITFTDNARHHVKVVSTTHVEVDETVIASPVNPDGTEANAEVPGLQFALDEVREVQRLSDQHVLFAARPEG